MSTAAHNVATRARSLALAVLIAVSGGVAHAQEVQMPAPSDAGEPIDPLVATGLAFLGMGTTAIVAGGAWMTTAPPEREECGVSGCHPVLDVERVEHQLTGSTVIGGGVGLVTAGALTAIVGASTAPKRGETRVSESRMVTGAVLTALGLAAGGIGNAWLATRCLECDPLPSEHSIPAFISSGVWLAIGIPLFATGADTQNEGERADETMKRRLPHDYRSPALMWTGGSMLVVSGVLAVSAVAVDQSCNPAGQESFACFGTGIGTAILAFGAGATHLGGAVLIAIGSVKVPTISAGPAGGALSWSFQ